MAKRAKRLSPKEQAVANAMGRMRLEHFQRICNNTVPCVYAAIAMALHEKGWRYKRINDLFTRSQEIWSDYCMEPGNMADQCYKMTGIDLRSAENIAMFGDPED